MRPASNLLGRFYCGTWFALTEERNKKIFEVLSETGRRFWKQRCNFSWLLTSKNFKVFFQCESRKKLRFFFYSQSVLLSCKHVPFYFGSVRPCFHSKKTQKGQNWLNIYTIFQTKKNISRKQKKKILKITSKQYSYIDNASLKGVKEKIIRLGLRYSQKCPFLLWRLTKLWDLIKKILPNVASKDFNHDVW